MPLVYDISVFDSNVAMQLSLAFPVSKDESPSYMLSKAYARIRRMTNLKKIKDFAIGSKKPYQYIVLDSYSELLDQK